MSETGNPKYCQLCGGDINTHLSSAVSFWQTSVAPVLNESIPLSCQFLRVCVVCVCVCVPLLEPWDVARTPSLGCRPCVTSSQPGDKRDCQSYCLSACWKCVCTSNSVSVNSFFKRKYNCLSHGQLWEIGGRKTMWGDGRLHVMGVRMGLRRLRCEPTV